MTVTVQQHAIAHQGFKLNLQADQLSVCLCGRVYVLPAMMCLYIFLYLSVCVLHLHLLVFLVWLCVSSCHPLSVLNEVSCVFLQDCTAMLVSAAGSTAAVGRAGAGQETKSGLLSELASATRHELAANANVRRLQKGVSSLQMRVSHQAASSQV